jgi:hypothetical protein
MNPARNRPVLWITLLSACSSDPAEPPRRSPESECRPTARACEPGNGIGWRDGAADSVALVELYAASPRREATDLAFHPDRPQELWVLHRQPQSSEPCDSVHATQAGCDALAGDVTVITNPGASQTSTTYEDPNAWHFMRRPTAFAFGSNGFFASVAEARTGNYQDDPYDYIGPTLWTSDLHGGAENCHDDGDGCFGEMPPGANKNGGHLDMLHDSPYGMGVAHEVDNVYWVFNGKLGSLDRYDFKHHHGPGNDDHSDAVLHRYATGQLSRVANVPGHMVYDHETAMLYVADTGNGRVVRVNTKSGTKGNPDWSNNDGIERVAFEGVEMDDIVPPGLLLTPSGLALHEGVLYVTCHTTSRVFAFDLEGKLLNALDTDLPAGTLAGITMGPDGRVYLVDQPGGRVLRIDPR